MKRLVLLILALPLVVLGQITPSNILFHGMGKSNDYALADINKDGTLDIVVASTSGLTWYPNEGTTQTNYTRQKPIDTTTPYFSVAAVDLNKDALPDLVVSVELNNETKLIWYQNKGNGNFSPKTILDEGITNSNSIELKDLNRDGWTDIVLLEETMTRIYLNDADGNFLKKSTLKTNFHPTHIADMNGDNYPDLIEVSSSGIRIMSNNTRGRFAEIESLLATTQNSFFHLTTLNEDSNMDIAQFIWDGNSVNLSLHLNANNGTFTNTINRNLNLPYDSDKDANFYLHHMDGDGLLDVVFILDNDEIYWLKNLENYNFSGEAMLAKAVFGIAIQPEDTNQDGIVDFIEVEGAQRYLLLHENNGTAQLLHTDVAENGRILQTTITDLNNDGYEDVLAFFAYDNEARAYFNNRAGGFTEELFLSDAPIEQLLDMDNDGDLDALTVSYNRALWSENDGTNKFRNRYLIAVDDAFSEAAFYCCTPTSPLVGDFNSDGIPDVLVYRRAAQALSWYDGKTSEEHLIQSPLAIQKMQVDDADNDDAIDIFVQQGARMIVLKNDGTGTFDMDARIDLESTLGETTLVDLNADNYLDILQYCSESSCTDDILYYENNRSGTFIKKNIASNYYSDLPPVVVDIDLDGDKDIVQSCFNAEQIASSLQVLLNDGNQNFALEPLEGLNCVRDIQLNDFDKDGVTDILVTSIPTAVLPEALFLANYDEMLHNRAENGTTIKALTAYPNPFSEEVKIPLPIKENDAPTYQIRIFNTFGIEIHPKILSNDEHFIINGSNLAIGIYNYQIWQNQKFLYTGNLVRMCN